MKLKNLALILSGWIILHSFVAPVSLVLAQESSPEPSTMPVATAESIATPKPEVTATPVSTPIPTVAPVPTPTIPPYSSEEYDVYKQEKNKKEAEEEAREGEWEAHEHDADWVAAHGGNEEYYVSGKWHAEQAAKAASATPTPTPKAFVAPLPVEPDPFAQISTDPFASPTPTPVVCDPLVLDGFGEADVSNDNCLELDNTSSASGTSGNNEVSHTDGDVSITTGNSSASGQLENIGNINVTDTTINTQSTTEESFANEGETDEFSETNESDLTVENNNTVVANNSMTVEGQSGGNIIEENDGDVHLTTGDIELIANMLNILNMNITGDDFLHLIVNIFGSLNGTLDLDDIATALGYDEDEALEVIAQTKATRVTNTNNVEVNNELHVKGVSGQNEVVGNDGEVDVVTGRIEILANVFNFINTNMSGSKWRFIMVNVFGSLQGDIVVPGTEQFVDTDNTSTYESSGSIDQTEVSNVNYVELVNDVSSTAVTGNNEQIANDNDGHTANTGITDVQNQILNYLNFNITGNNWVFLIVNVFGKWMGQIVGFGDEAAMDAPDQGAFAALATGKITEGDTQNTTADTTTVTSTNNAKVTNDINVEGISGGNHVNENDGQTSINTGWVEIDTNLLNIINTNITGRSWMVVFLNVFGDFMGNLLFGNQAQQEYLAIDTPEQSTNAHVSNHQPNNQTVATAEEIEPVVEQVPQNGQVLSLSSINDEESVSVYQAVEKDEENLSDDHLISKSVLGSIKDFLYNLLSNFLHVVEPVLAHLHNIISIS